MTTSLLTGCVLLLAIAAFAVEGTRSPTSQLGSPGDDQVALRVMSFNIRFDNPGDGEHAWPNRRPLVGQIIRFHQPDILGLQEVLDHQLQQLAEDLPGYEHIGVGRNDGKTGGEYSPILYRLDRLELLKSGTFWLSDTPHEVGSKGWDAALPRIATWARFRDRRGGGELLAINTHFDHRGHEARRRSAELIADQAEQLAGDLPVILTGDFNATPDSPPIETLTGSFDDAFTRSDTGHFGPEGTFGTFEPHEGSAARIDYIFVSPGTRVLRHATLAHHWNARHASDHWPVLAEVVLQTRQEDPDQ